MRAHSLPTLLSAFFAISTAGLGGCGGSADSSRAGAGTQTDPAAPGAPLAPEAPAPATTGLLSGDCRSKPGVISPIFTPGAYTNSNIPGGDVLVAGGRVYASLVGARQDNSYGPGGIFVAEGASGDAWQPFASTSGTGLMLGQDHLYWSEVVSQGEWSRATASLAYRGDSGAAVAVPNTRVNADVSSAFLVRGDTAFTFYCPEGPPTNVPCASPSDVWTLTATHVPDGKPIFTKSVPQSDVWIHSSLVADDQFLYWTAATPASKVLRMPIGGGDVTDVPVPLATDASESVTSLVRTSTELLVTALGPRDSAMTDELVLYRLPISGAAFGTPTRVSLGRTYLEESAMAFDESSVYFTYDDPSASAIDTPRTIARACLDGTNKTTIGTGTAYGLYSVEGLAVGATRAFFTSQNQVYAFDK